jgi:hypothetical protein
VKNIRLSADIADPAAVPIGKANSFMQKVGVILALAIVLMAGSARGQCPCRQISGSVPSARGDGIIRNMACGEFYERLGGFLVRIECIPDCGLDYSYYISRDRGNTWAGVSEPHFSDLDEDETGVRMFGTGLPHDRVRYRTVASGHGERKQWLLERSNDQGKSWIKRRAIWAETGVKISSFVEVNYDSANPEIVAATVHWKLGDPWQLFMSKDGGETFSFLAPDVHNFAVSRTNPRVIYATTFAGGMLKSVDSGQTWSEIGQQSFPVERAGIAKIPLPMRVYIDPSNGDKVFVIRSNGLHRSENGGETWCQVDLGVGRQYQVCSFVIDPKNTRRMFLGTYDRGMFRSNDGGCHWEAVDLTGKAKANRSGSSGHLRKK